MLTLELPTYGVAKIIGEAILINTFSASTDRQSFCDHFFAVICKGALYPLHIFRKYIHTIIELSMSVR